MKTCRSAPVLQYSVRTFQNLLKPQHTDANTNTQPPGTHDSTQMPAEAELRRTLGTNQPDWKRLKKTVKVKTWKQPFSSEPPTRINANSLIRLPPFLVFPFPSISWPSPPHLSFPLCSHLVFLPRCAPSAQCFYIICIFGFIFFLKDRASTSQKSAASCFLSLPVSLSILASLVCALFFFFVSFTCCVPNRSHLLTWQIVTHPVLARHL